MKLSWILVLLLLAGVALFSVQNAQPMSVHFFTWETSMSAALVIQLAALVGGFVGLCVGALSRRSARRRERDLERAREQGRVEAERPRQSFELPETDAERPVTYRPPEGKA